MKTQFFTSESVTEGHPDKICDQISDQILDELLKEDPMSRCACETTAEPGAVHIMGEITSAAQVDYSAAARRVIRRIGYTQEAYGFTDACRITCSIHSQSPDIAMGVDHALESRQGDQKDIGAGDQGMMFGFACCETPEYMPLAITLANRLTARLTQVRKEGILPYLRPDGKAQVTVQYDDGAPVRVQAVVVSAQHDPQVDMRQLTDDIAAQVIRAVIPADMLDADTKIYINPTGRFVLGGPAADTGLTGRKIIADTYGGYARHGGGAFSGKDATKVDRSAAYMARFIAKNIVASGAARSCELQLSYSIGVARPVSVHIDTNGTGKVDDAVLADWVAQNIDLRPAAIIEALDLRKPVFSGTAAYGHFGKPGFTWERIDPQLIAKLRALYA
jgi:S-adenosylmethionine synthetase